VVGEGAVARGLVWLAAAVLAGVVASPGSAQFVTLDDGGLHVLDDATFAADTVLVHDAADGATTSVLVTTGAEVLRIRANDASEVAFEDGAVSFLVAANRGRIAMSGGVSSQLIVVDDAFAHVSGGTLLDRITMSGRPHLLVTGGHLGWFGASGGLLEIRGGSVGNVNAGHATVRVLGGELRELTQLQGFADLELLGGTMAEPVRGYLNRGTVAAIGTGFAIDGVPAPFGERPLTDLVRLTGTLVLGAPLDVVLQSMPNTVLALRAPTPVIVKPRGGGPIRAGSPARVFGALLGSESFDAAQVDGGTVTLGHAHAQPTHDLSDPAVFARHLSDPNRDGRTDLVAHFRADETGLSPGDTSACLVGEGAGGAVFAGCADVEVVE
jgi:hypothetical protein